MEIQKPIPVPAGVDETIKQQLDKAEDAMHKLSILCSLDTIKAEFSWLYPSLSPFIRN